MSTNLYAASRQWANRPPDERFETLDALRAASFGYFQTAATAEVAVKELSVRETEGDDVELVGPTGVPAKFTNYSFGQLSRLVNAPSEYLAKLPAELVARNMNYGLSKKPDEAKTNILLHQNGHLIFRAATGMVYNRVWNYEVADFALSLRDADSGWRVPPARPAFADQPGTRPATEADVLDLNSGFGLSVKVGDPIAPAGLYASASDLFIVLVNQNRTVEASSTEVLNRGLFVKNSEVGDAALEFTGFRYVNVCGNHIFWDVSGVVKVSFRHVGKTLRERIADAMNAIKASVDSNTAEDKAKLAELRRFLIGDNKQEVVEAVSQKGLLTQRDALAAYDLAEQYSDIHGDPRSKWGFAAGITRLSQKSPYGDKRTDLDTKAGKVLQIKF